MPPSQTEKEHAESVAALCEKMARRLSLPEADIRRLKRVGFLHDIGKIVLDPKLVRAENRLTEAEEGEYRKHPGIGYRILNLFDDTMDLSEVVLCHHERWDGTGYPRGLRGEEIPLLARILSVADLYERALHQTDSPAGGGRETALQTVRAGMGSCFDPQIAAVFIELVGASEG